MGLVLASASSSGQDWAFITLVFPALVLIAILFLRYLVGVAAREGDRSMRAVASCPWNDLYELEVGRARIAAVVALDDELLVELQWQPRNGTDAGTVSWLVAPRHRTALAMFDRWHASDAVVAVYRAPGRYLLRTTNARVSVRPHHTPR